MTRPRRIVPGQLCFVTAEAVRRMFLFVPQREVVRLVQYLFALSAKRFGMRIHEALWMSNHFHVLMTDVDGRLPDFMHYLDMLLARSLNAIRGTSGTVFEKEYGLTAETDEQKIFEHAVYILANPCAADLVRRSRQWPGFSTLRMKYGEVRRYERPKIGLWKSLVGQAERRRKQRREPKRAQKRGKPSRLPEFAELTLERPPIFSHMSDSELRSEILRRLDEHEIELIGERRKTGHDVAGVAQVLAQPWYLAPEKPRDLFGLKPTVAGKDKQARIAALQRRREFEEAYDRTRVAFLGGDRDALWPFGTWLMRVRFGLPCVAPP